MAKKKDSKKATEVVSKTKKESSTASKPSSKAGRPKKEFTEEQRLRIINMAVDNCHLDTIAMALQIPKQTLVNNFGTIIKQKRAEGRVMLRRAQNEAALKGNPALLIFLGKNELGQSDKQEIEHALNKETMELLGLIDGKSKGQLPDAEEGEDAR